MVQTRAMEFFCFHRDRAGSGPLRRRMVEQHWTYMDRYDSALALRGPAFDDDEQLVGSVHVVEVATSTDARAFAFDEPCYQAGAYRDVMLRRWDNVLGRSMWQYPRCDHTDGLFLCVGFEAEPRGPLRAQIPDADLVAFGHLLSDDATLQLGTVAIVRAPGARAARDVLGDSLTGIEAYRWTFGGRR